MARVRIAIPSEGEGGLDGMRSGHFGHCDVFTFVDLEDGIIKEVSTIPNVDHTQGGCMVPVSLLARHKVNACGRRHRHAAADGFPAGRYHGLS